MKLTTRLRTLLQFAFLFCTAALFAVPTARAAKPTIYAFNQSGSGTINLGESVSLNWSVSHGASVSLSPDIGPVSGTEITVTPTQTSTYTLTATNSSGSVSKTKKITVIVPPTVNSVAATPDTVLPGKAATLKWTGTGATYFTVATDDGTNLGNVFGTSLKVYPQATTNYTVTAVNSVGTGTRSVLVTVVPPGPKPSIASFAAAPATITDGQSTTINWSVSGADSLSISPGVGAVSGTSTTVSPDATTTYTLTAKNLNGSVTKKATVTVNVAPPAIASFTATPDAIVAGQSSALAWSVAGADSLSISPDVGAVTGTSVSVAPTSSTTYTLTAVNAGGTVTKTVALAVTPPTPPPVIHSFTASSSSITQGQSVTLNWSVANGDTVSIAADVGPSPGTVTGTSLTVSPAATTVYTLTAFNPTGSAAQSVTVAVANPSPVSVQLNPSAVQINTGATRSFLATVVGSTSQAVTWSVVETGGGSITSAGVYTAPTTPGTFHVQAVSTADPAATAQATITVTSPVATPPANPSSDGTHFVHLMSPNAGQRFLAPGFLRVFVAAKDLNNWPDRNRAAFVEIMVDDVVHATIPGAQSEYWVYKTNLFGLPAGQHRVWARAHFVDGKVFDSEVMSIVVEEPPTYANVINLPADVVLTGSTNYEFIGSPNARIRINGNGFTIRSDSSWTGRLTLKYVDVTNLGVLLDPTPGVQVTTTSAVEIAHCIFDATNSLDVTVNDSATAVIRANEFRSNMFMNVAQFPINLTTGPDATDPVVRLQGSSTAAHFFQGNNVGLSTIDVNHARNWLIGGSTAADGNVFIGPRVGLVLQNGTGHQIRGNISDQIYYGGWSQGNNFELSSDPGLLVEHNLISGGSWPVRGTGGTFRYNLVLNAGEDWLWITQDNAQVHHNIFAEGANDRAGIFLLYGPQGVEFTNNTLDGFGLEQNQIPLLADDGSSSNIASNVFYRFHGTPIVGIRGTGTTVSANYNLFHNPGVSAIRNYQDNRAPAQDIGGLNAQVDPQFATPTPPSYNTINRGDVWNRTLTLGQLLSTYRAYYTPAPGSPLTDAGDPAGGAGNDIGAIGSGALNSADQFGLLEGGTTGVSVSVQPGTKSLTAGATANFTAIVFGDTNQAVTWSVVEAGGGSITNAGLYTAPTTPGTFHVKAVAAADPAVSAQATVIVAAAGPSAPTITSFAANPSVIQPGNSSTLSWSVSGADSVSIAPGIGAVTGNSVAVTPSATTTYTLTAANTAGSVIQTATVTVNASTGPAINSFTASSYNVEAGEAVTLTWTTTQMGSLWLSADAGGDPGSVAPNSSIVLHPQTTTRYAISGWDGQGMISKVLIVNVGPPPAPVINSFTATPNTIPIGGSTTLSWSVANATSVSIAADVGASPGAVTGDNLTVSPTQTTTYTITAALGAQSVTRTATVTVTGPAAPTIGSFYAQPAFIQTGASTTLHWSVSGAQEISISGGVGVVSGNSVTVSPAQTTTYTLSATNEIGTTTRTAVVTIYVPNPNGGVTHPRIWLTPDLVAAMRQRAAQNDPAWIRLRNACDTYAAMPVAFPDETPSGNAISGGYQYYDYMKPAFQLALGYQVALTVDPTRAGNYAAKAREILMALSDPLRHGNPLIDSGWAIRAYVPALAIGYDWIFETLSDSDRAQVYTEINRWVAAYESGGFGRSFPQGNYFAGYYAAKALGALATEGENPQGPAMWDDWLNRVHYGMVQPYHQQWLSGGGAPDGWNYGPFETINMVRPLAAAFTAKGLDLIHDAAHPHAYPDGHAKWITQFTWPDMKTVSDRGLVYSHDNPTGTDVNWATQYAGLLRFANGDNAPIAQRYALDLRSAQGVNAVEPWADFLFHSASAPTANYRTDLSYRTLGDGQVAMRSSWDNDAVWGAFQSGPYTGYVHSAEEFFDEGSLTIQRGGVQFLVNAWAAMLRHTPGTADGAGSVFTYLHNDLHEISADGVYHGRRNFNTFYAVRPGGYWGQGASLPGETATTLSRFEEGTDYVLMRGANLEGMYFDDHPIQSWHRTVVYLRPQLFVVHDRTSVSSANVDNWMAWHVAAAPAEQTGAAPGTHRIDVIDTRPAFGGNLFRGRISTVLPAGNVVSTVNLADKDKVYRLEVRPGTPAAANTWLTVFDAAASATQAGTVTALTNAAGNLSTDTAEGALIRNAAGNYAVLFSKSANAIAGSFTLKVPVDDTYLLVADLAPSTGYSVTATIANGELTLTVAPGGSVMTTAQGTLKIDVTAAGVVTPL